VTIYLGDCAGKVHYFISHPALLLFLLIHSLLHLLYTVAPLSFGFFSTLTAGHSFQQKMHRFFLATSGFLHIFISPFRQCFGAPPRSRTKKAEAPHNVASIPQLPNHPNNPQISVIPPYAQRNAPSIAPSSSSSSGPNVFSNTMFRSSVRDLTASDVQGAGAC